MKYLALEIKSFLKSDFDYKVYLYSSLFILVLIVFNYSIDFEDSYIDHKSMRNIRWLLFFLFNSVGYYGTLYVSLWISGQTSRLKNKEFLFLSATGLFIYSLYRSVDLRVYIRSIFEPDVYRYVYYIAWNAYSIFLLIIPLGLVWFFYHRSEHYGLYGLKYKDVNFKPYVMMLAIMIPVLFIASYSEGLSSYYPVAKRSGSALFAQKFDLPSLLPILFFEFVYLFDFISCELFFRGFMVIGLMRYIGKDVLLPMVTIYAMCHFGKPFVETVGSIFGGYILGVLAYKSKNIWGGVFLHVGVALFMEIFGFMQMG